MSCTVDAHWLEEYLLKNQFNKSIKSTEWIFCFIGIDACHSFTANPYFTGIKTSHNLKYQTLCASQGVYFRLQDGTFIKTKQKL